MTTTTTAAASHTAPWLLFVILGAVSAFNPVAMDMYLPALPQIGRELGVTASVAQLSLSSFFIGGALGQFAFGPASDRFGRRPPLFVGAVLFFAASIGCALAPSIDVLIGLRLVQGFAASCGMVIARAV
ncbi:MAG: MFS transporter, partial [Hyphomonadaceae bacterium]